jgi:hypothetical protein
MTGEVLTILGLGFGAIGLLVLLHVFQGPPPKEPPKAAE